MAQTCDIIHLCLSNSPQVEAVFHGSDAILAGARDGLVVIDTTTADPTSTAVSSEALAAKGGPLDATVGRMRRCDVSCDQTGAGLLGW